MTKYERLKAEFDRVKARQMEATEAMVEAGREALLAMPFSRAILCHSEVKVIIDAALRARVGNSHMTDDRVTLSDTLNALADRVEAATGPSYVLNVEIARSQGYHSPILPTGHTGLIPSGSIPAYTASLDAAMTLVPEGMQGQVQFGRLAGAWCGKPMEDACDFNVAATPALALTAAALRALAQQEDV